MPSASHKRAWGSLVVPVACLALLLALPLTCAGCQPPAAPVVAEPSPTETTAPSQTPTPSASVTLTSSPTSTATVTSTPSPSPSPTATLGPLPPVAASYPIDGDRAVPHDARLRIVLQERINLEQIEATFTLSPTVPGEMSWLDARQLTFTPREPLTDGRYTLRLELRYKAAPLLASSVFTATFTGERMGAPIPILMYHRLIDLPADAAKVQKDWAVSPANLEKQFAYLSQNGYHSIDLTQLVAYVKRQEPLPPRPFIISMDDGYREVLDVAWPLLDRYGFGATIFVLPGSIEYSAYLTWEQMKTLRGAGFVFGSHTVKHPNLLKISRDEARREMSESKKEIEAQLGQPVTAFCFPQGDYNREIIALLQQVGYEAACTLNPGYMQPKEGTGLFELRRLWIHYTTTLEEFADQLPW